ncbi:hypothetical protein DYE50_09525 [Treponema ruminis]|uniref:Uncharacterized protein n=1 Tax=Treponema ruminis TaxID=744515 RepID=A0A7W8G9H1_9SPIR|nr:hypothetical protein [Treponema ruminis]MBB5226290.1 hypothetical protein [Treponema ruminis]QSI02805.1 hypothetical protein DYE50_09525 [Treponema ruminis]
MKKIIASLVAAALLSFAAFAEGSEGLSVTGYLRAGMTDTFDSSVYSTNKWMQGGYFGGGTRLRVNIDYTKAFGGLTFRYQVDPTYETAEEAVPPRKTKTVRKSSLDFFAEKNVKWAMAYANLLDGQVIAEAGVISDRFTKTGGWEDTGIDGGKGFRVVVVPKVLAGLTLAAQATDKFADKYSDNDSKVKDGKALEGDIKFDEKVLGFSAKYDHALGFVTGGAALAGYYYGSVGLKAIENLTLVGELFYDSTDATKKANGDNATTMIVAWAEYTGIEKVLLGAYSYINLCDGEHEIEITPAASYDVNSLLKVSAEASLYLSSNDKKDTYVTISPAVTFKASDKATATASALISTDTDQAKHSASAGVRYNF